MKLKSSSWLLLGSIMVLAFFIRYTGLGDYGLWRDEVIVAKYAEFPMTSLNKTLSQDVHPPLFFILQSLVFKLVGYDAWTEYTIRLLPLIFGLVTVFFMYFAGNHLISHRAGAIAAFLLAINPMHVHYSREARNYSLVILFVFLAIWASIAFLKKPDYRTAIMVSLPMIVLIYTHNIALFAIMPLSIMCFFPLSRLKNRKYRFALGVLFGFVFLASIPRVSGLLHQTRMVAKTGLTGSGPCEWLKPYWQVIFPYQIPMTFSVLSHGSVVPRLNHVFIAEQYESAYISGFIGFLLIVSGFRFRRQWNENLAGFVLFNALIMPLILIFLISCISTPIYTTGRADTIVLPAYILLLSAGIDRFFKNSKTLSETYRFRSKCFCGGVILLAVLTAFSLKPLHDELTSDYKNYLKLRVHYLAFITSDNDVFIVNNIDLYAFQYYLPRMNRNLHLIGFPSARENHPLWLNHTAYNDDLLLREAVQTVVRAARVSLLHASTVWVEVNWDRLGQDILLDEFNKKMIPGDSIRIEQSSYKSFKNNQES